MQYQSLPRIAGLVASLAAALTIVGGASLRSEGQVLRYVLDDFQQGLRVVQPLETQPNYRYLWKLQTPGGNSVTEVTSSPPLNGNPVLHNRFDQTFAGSPPGSTYQSDWQLYFYPYTVYSPDFPAEYNGWHFMREFIQPFSYPNTSYVTGRVNRLKFWIKVPEGTLAQVGGGQHNFEFGTFHREAVSSSASAESNGWHFYHFANLAYTGEWHQVIIDTHPQHQRATDTTKDVGDKLHLSSVTPDLTYMDLMTGFYLHFPYLVGANGWRKPVDFYMGGFELYEEKNPENVAQVSTLNGVYVPGTKRIHVGWHFERGNGTTKHEVRYSFSDISQSGWNAATPAPNGVLSPVDPYYMGMEYDTTAINTTGRTMVYVAVKPQNSALFRQIAIPIGAVSSPGLGLLPPSGVRVR